MEWIDVGPIEELVENQPALRKADVELYIGYYDDAGAFLSGHYVTLYGLDAAKLFFVDPAGDHGGRIDGAIDAKIDYTFNAALKQLVLGPYAGTPKDAKARIDFAFAEAPKGVPEPATWAMMLLGFGVLAIRLRHVSAARRARA